MPGNAIALPGGSPTQGLKRDLFILYLSAVGQR